MEYNKAIDILGLPELHTDSQLRKNYHLKALQFHPDKCSGDDESRAQSAARFREVHEAYKYLTNTWSPPHYRPNKRGYTNTLAECLGLFNITINADQARRLVTMIEDKCHSMSLQVLRDMSLGMIIDLHRFLMQHQVKLGISTNMLLKIEEVLQEKAQTNTVVIVHAEIDNLMNQEMYILKGEDGNHLVPLWHPTTHIQRKNEDVIVLCVPVLPPNVTLDDKNDIHVNICIQINSLLDSRSIDVRVGTKTFKVLTSKLRVTRHQIIIMSGAGIPLPHAKADKHIPLSDIVVHIKCE